MTINILETYSFSYVNIKIKEKVGKDRCFFNGSRSVSFISKKEKICSEQIQPKQSDRRGSCRNIL